jgi:hypothetical protein
MGRLGLAAIVVGASWVILVLFARFTRRAEPHQP